MNYLFNEHLLGLRSVPGRVLDAGDIVIKKRSGLSSQVLAALEWKQTLNESVFDDSLEQGCEGEKSRQGVLRACPRETLGGQGRLPGGGGALQLRQGA